MTCARSLGALMRSTRRLTSSKTSPRGLRIGDASEIWSREMTRKIWTTRAGDGQVESSATGLSKRTELPRTSLIVPSIEARFAEILKTRAAHNLSVLRGARINARTLADAARRMTDVDLDVAWRAALRGDGQVVEARLRPHVRAATPTRRAKGSPWRTTGYKAGSAT